MALYFLFYDFVHNAVVGLQCECVIQNVIPIHVGNATPPAIASSFQASNLNVLRTKAKNVITGKRWLLHFGIRQGV